VQKMRQFSDVARERGIPMEELWKWVVRKKL
jgi:small subunit ribosomal protein S5